MRKLIPLLLCFGLLSPVGLVISAKPVMAQETGQQGGAPAPSPKPKPKPKPKPGPREEGDND